MGKEYTEAQKKATLKYMADKTDNIQLRMIKGTKERWKEAADSAGVSMTQFVRDAVETAIQKQESAGE